MIRMTINAGTDCDATQKATEMFSGTVETPVCGDVRTNDPDGYQGWY